MNCLQRETDLHAGRECSERALYLYDAFSVNTSVGDFLSHDNNPEKRADIDSWVKQPIWQGDNHEVCLF